MRNGCVARDFGMVLGERGNILYGYSTDEQRGSIPKDRQPGGLFTHFVLGSKSQKLATHCNGQV